MQPKPFDGFSMEALDFINEWRLNNDRDWFKPRKSDYDRMIKEPALRFISDLGNKLKLLSRDIEFDLGNNGSLLRIYRDVRFSQDKRPYNPNIRMVFWEGTFKKAENPGFFIKIDQKGAGVFAGMYMFPKELLNVYRNAVINSVLGAELDKAIDDVKKAGTYHIGGKFYKRVPRGYDAAHERAELLMYNGLYAMTTNISVDDVCSADLLDICFQHCVNMRPIQHWIVRLLEK
ncbi:DUF2461 domain-containing protein [candidate division KSB1 bacterium]|nr:DUF2461 domain-containing protein [candidate division KSB1 bacterium]